MRFRISLPGLLAAILMFTVTVGMHEAAVANPYGCNKKGCWCTGEKDCAKMSLELREKQKCKTWRCDIDTTVPGYAGVTVCWCDL